MNTVTSTRTELKQDPSTEQSAVPILVIIPAHEAARTLPSCLEALRRSRQLGKPDVLVVCDGADLEDAPPGVRHVQSPVSHSAAAARNRGAAELREGVLVFVDADVLVDEESLHRLVEPILTDAADATVGNYSHDVRGLTFLQKYKQLHISTVYGRRKGYLKSEFWTAIGAIRAEAFHQVGGFDPSFRGACGEDTELGQRLSASGFRVLAVPEATGKHLHNFTLLRLLGNDLRKGSQLMLKGLQRRNELGDNRHCARSEVLAVFCAGLLPALGVLSWILPLLSVAALEGLFFGAWLLGRQDQFRAYAREGPLFLLRAVPVALMLDWVRVLCVPLGFALFGWERISARANASPRQIGMGKS